jgi:tetratricopeptide (TPR) repeat protein
VTAAAPVAFPEASSGSLGRESELLARALAKLRRDRDARTALALLDQHARDFPAGALRLEADVARVDALLALGRSAEALGLLERLPIDRLGRGAELRVLRGELRAQRDPANALADFERALAAEPSPDLAERALYGRAGGHLRLGDEARGRADLEAYLARFPNGRFAAEARRRLGD